MYMLYNICVLLVLSFINLLNGECVLNFKDMPERPPHLIKDAFTKQPQLMYPRLVEDEQHDPVVGVTLGDAHWVTVSCNGPRNYLVMNNKSYAHIYCRDHRLVYNEQYIKFEDLNCRRRPKPTLRTYLEGCGRGDFGGLLYMIGWKVEKMFINQITLCFDPQRQTTLYTSHVIQGEHINYKVKDPSRPYFKKGGMFSFDIRRAYTKSSQSVYLNSIFPGIGSGQYYFARGHLAPDGDFVYTAEQDATYFYGNVLPQWQQFNNGNWKALEFSVRELSEMLREPIQVHTGGHVISGLEVTYLSPMMRAAAIPHLFWKVVYLPSSNEAVVIVAINRVDNSLEISRVVKDYCEDTCDQLPWVDWNIKDYTRGSTFCCTLPSIKRLIQEIPVSI